MIFRALRWTICILLLQSSSPIVEPAWPDPPRVDSSRAQPHPQLQILSDGASDRADPLPQGDSGVEALDTEIRDTPVCIVWTRQWAGALGSTLLYRVRRLTPERIAVGYFAYWTSERPFGDNDLTRWILPAIAIDAVYSHLLFIMPGLQRVMYGPGDIEGVRVIYREERTGRLLPTAVIAEDDRHRERSIHLEDAVDEEGRIVLRTDVWSHQLGGEKAVATAHTNAWRRCFVGKALRPLTQETIQAFRLGTAVQPRRAKPAWRLQAGALPYQSDSKEGSTAVGQTVAAFTPGQPIGSANCSLQQLFANVGSTEIGERGQRGL